MAKQVVRYKSRQEWLEARSGGIGASEVASVLGLNPFETRYQLWRRKKGFDAPKQENFAMRAGHYLEDAVAKFYADATNCRIIKSTAEDFTIMNPDKPFLRVSPDRLYWRDGAKHSERNKCVLECKTTQMEVDAATLPQHWFCQIQMNMGVAELEQGALAWLTMGREFGYRDILFDKDFFDWMVEEVDKFWTDNIIGNREPDLYTVDDVQLKYPKNISGKTVEADSQLVDACLELKEIKKEAGELDSRKKELESTIKMALGDAEALVLPGGSEEKPTVLATWTTAKDGTKFNEKKFAADKPELYASYRYQVPGTRRFLLK